MGWWWCPEACCGAYVHRRVSCSKFSTVSSALRAGLLLVMASKGALVSLAGLCTLSLWFVKGIESDQEIGYRRCQEWLN